MIKYVMLPKCYFKRLIWGVQLEKEKAYEPNTHWNYSSGTTNLLSIYYEISLRRIRSIWTLVCCFD
jgi:hypothetical protein